MVQKKRKKNKSKGSKAKESKCDNCASVESTLIEVDNFSFCANCLVKYHSGQLDRNLKAMSQSETGEKGTNKKKKRKHRKEKTADSISNEQSNELSNEDNSSLGTNTERFTFNSDSDEETEFIIEIDDQTEPASDSQKNYKNISDVEITDQKIVSDNGDEQNEVDNEDENFSDNDEENNADEKKRKKGGGKRKKKKRKAEVPETKTVVKDEILPEKKENFSSQNLNQNQEIEDLKEQIATMKSQFFAENKFLKSNEKIDGIFQSISKVIGELKNKVARSKETNQALFVLHNKVVHQLREEIHSKNQRLAKFAEHYPEINDNLVVDKGDINPEIVQLEEKLYLARSEVTVWINKYNDLLSINENLKKNFEKASNEEETKPKRQPSPEKGIENSDTEQKEQGDDEYGQYSDYYEYSDEEQVEETPGPGAIKGIASSIFTWMKG